MKPTKELDKLLTKINHDLDRFDELISQITEEEDLSHLEKKIDQISL